MGPDNRLEKLITMAEVLVGILRRECEEHGYLVDPYKDLALMDKLLTQLKEEASEKD